MVEQYWMKDICGLCPFSRSNTLPLHPERAEDFANMAQNPYSDFVCHKTGFHNYNRLNESDEIVRGAKSLTCNGFLSLQVNESGEEIDGFTPSADAFCEAWDMITHHEDLWEKEYEGVE